MTQYVIVAHQNSGAVDPGTGFTASEAMGFAAAAGVHQRVFRTSMQVVRSIPPSRLLHLEGTPNRGVQRVDLPVALEQGALAFRQLAVPRQRVGLV